jgi:hypothetical protein
MIPSIFRMVQPFSSNLVRLVSPEFRLSCCNSGQASFSLDYSRRPTYPRLPGGVGVLLRPKGNPHVKVGSE